MSQSSTLNDSNISVPHWAKTVVWYQIFPERFRNGDPGNDPTLTDIDGAYPHDQNSPWQIHPWTSDWYELQPYEKKNRRTIWFNLQRRRYGGDIQGILDKLDYLSDLGIGAIYLNPVFESPSSHKYDGATYHHIDSNFGPDPIGDRKLIDEEVPHDPATWVWTSADKLMLQLVKQVHIRGMKIIFDGVFNHVGLNSWIFRDVLQNQQNSRYKDWLAVKSWDNPQTGEKFDYKGWFGVRELPELRQDENGIVAEPRKYIFDVTRRWMDPNGDGDPDDGIDGWRLDVAYCIAHPFWKDWRRHVKSINAEAYLTGEVIDSIKVLQPYLKGDEFDAMMNYNFAFACAEYFIAEKNRITTKRFDDLLRELREAFPEQVAYVQQNLFDSHDTNRLSSHIVNRDMENYRNWGAYHKNSKANNPAFNTRKPNVEELRIQKLFAIFQMTYLGAPMICYGDETGMWGANDPCCRKPMVWDDLHYADETCLPNQSKRSVPDKVEVNRELFGHYRKLIHIRNENAALQLGDFQTMLVDDANECYAFSRNSQEQSILVVLNNANDSRAISVPIDSNRKYVDLLNDNRTYDSQNGNLILNLPSKWGCILKKE